MRNLKSKLQAVIDRLENKKTYHRKNLNTIEGVNKDDSSFDTGFIVGINIAIDKIKLLMDEAKLSIILDEEPDEMYIVYAMHREREYCGGMSWVGESYIVKNEEKAELLAKILQSIEKDDDITWEILDTNNSLNINKGDKIALDKNNEIIINQGEINETD